MSHAQDASFGRWLAGAARARPEHLWCDSGSGIDEQVARPVLQHVLGTGRCPRVVRFRPARRGVQAARLVARILRGERPQDLPVEGANKIELAINLKTARSQIADVPDVLVERPGRSSRAV